MAAQGDSTEGGESGGTRIPEEKREGNEPLHRVLPALDPNVNVVEALTWTQMSGFRYLPLWKRVTDDEEECTGGKDEFNGGTNAGEGGGNHGNKRTRENADSLKFNRTKRKRIFQTFTNMSAARFPLKQHLSAQASIK